MSQTEPAMESTPHEAQPAPPRRRGFPRIAWAIVTVLVLVSILLNRGVHEQEGLRASMSDVQENILLVQGQYLVAASQFPGMNAEQLYDGAKSLNTGPALMRLRFIVLAGELAGAEEAMERASEIEGLFTKPDAATESDQHVLRVLQALYADYQQGDWDAPSVARRDRYLLRDELGWFGALALAPQRTEPDGSPSAEVTPARAVILTPAWFTFGTVIGAFIVGAGVGVAGLAGVTIFIVLIARRKIRSAICTGTGVSAIYAETFAVWMILFFLLTIVAGFAAAAFPQGQILISATASMTSLAAIGWPVLRGLPWSQVRHEIGWYAGGRPLREILWGPVCYVSNLPVLGLGLLATLALLALSNAATGSMGGMESAEAPVHPVVEWASGADWLSRLQIFLLACVAAPVMEETIFRGVLYRHLREATGRWRVAASVLFSAVATSLVFAVIHPQGLIATPALMAVAAGLALAREWRGSLVTSMVMHGLNNGVMMLLLFSLV